MRRLTPEEVDKRRHPRNLCSQCGEPILGRAGNASTCLLHRAFRSPPSRSELVAFIDEYETLIETLRAALAAMDEEAE